MHSLLECVVPVDRHEVAALEVEASGGKVAMVAAGPAVVLLRLLRHGTLTRSGGHGIRLGVLLTVLRDQGVAVYLVHGVESERRPGRVRGGAGEGRVGLGARVGGAQGRPEVEEVVGVVVGEVEVVHVAGGDSGLSPNSDGWIGSGQRGAEGEAGGEHQICRDGRSAAALKIECLSVSSPPSRRQ